MAFNCYACIVFYRLSGLVYTHTHARTHARAGVNSSDRQNFCPLNSLSIRYTLIHLVRSFIRLIVISFFLSFFRLIGFYFYIHFNL